LDFLKKKIAFGNKLFKNCQFTKKQITNVAEWILKVLRKLK